MQVVFLDISCICHSWIPLMSICLPLIVNAHSVSAFVIVVDIEHIALSIFNNPLSMILFLSFTRIAYRNVIDTLNKYV